MSGGGKETIKLLFLRPTIPEVKRKGGKRGEGKKKEKEQY